MYNKDDVITIEITQGMLDNASKIAKKKAIHTYDKWKNHPRDVDQKELDQFLGLLAHEAIKEFFKREGIEYQDYDKERHNNFEKPDKYDFKAYGKFIQIKSSLNKNPEADVDFVINNYNFPIEVVNGDVFIQVYHLDTKLNKAHIISWIDKDKLEKYGEENTVWGVKYEKWCPLSYGYKMKDLKKFLMEF